MNNTRCPFKLLPGLVLAFLFGCLVVPDCAAQAAGTCDTPSFGQPPISLSAELRQATDRSYFN
ncbi:MAG TPA: hypothetical protein VF658_15510 [Pyrinomonadaceae bacterium]|jgi:hypothetical protein